MNQELMILRTHTQEFKESGTDGGEETADVHQEGGGAEQMDGSSGKGETGFEPLSDLPGVRADTVWQSGCCVWEQRGPALRSDPHQPQRLFNMPTRSHQGQAVHLNVK